MSNWVTRTVLAGAFIGAVSAALAAPAAAQDPNLLLPVAEIERRLATEAFEVFDWRGSRRPDDRTQRVAIQFADSVMVAVKWANAPTGGAAFNNQPRYEAAAYAFQKLFLDEDEYVVPPTVLRAFPLEFVRAQMPDVQPTFDNAPASVLVALQYWLSNVSPRDFWDARRARSDSVYGRYIGNFNILTYLIRHSDANTGNYLISTDGAPRVFSVDNGVAFGEEESQRGTQFRDLQVQRFPRRTIERLERVTRAQLDSALAVLAEFEIRDGALVPVPPGENLQFNRGVRRNDERVQIGLTRNEITAIEERLRSLLRKAHERVRF